jgi:hypothetical protein
MVELVDTQHLNCCEATRAGSIPALGTKFVSGGLVGEKVWETFEPALKLL